MFIKTIAYYTTRALNGNECCLEYQVIVITKRLYVNANRTASAHLSESLTPGEPSSSCPQPDLRIPLPAPPSRAIILNSAGPQIDHGCPRFTPGFCQVDPATLYQHLADRWSYIRGKQLLSLDSNKLLLYSYPNRVYQSHYGSCSLSR